MGAKRGNRNGGMKTIDHTESPSRKSARSRGSVIWRAIREQNGSRGVNTDESSRTRCNSIESDPIDQAADSLPVITRGRRSIARINHLALDRLSIPIFPRGIGYLPARSWPDKAQLSFRLAHCSSRSLEPAPPTPAQIKCLGLAPIPSPF